MKTLTSPKHPNWTIEKEDDTHFFAIVEWLPAQANPMTGPVERVKAERFWVSQ